MELAHANSVCGGQENFEESVVFFHLVDVGKGTQVVRLGRKHRSPLICLIGSLSEQVFFLCVFKAANPSFYFPEMISNDN